MAKNWSLSQFYTWVDGLFVDNNTRDIDEADFRDGLKVTAEFADDTKAAINAMVSSFISRSLNNVAAIYVRGDTGNDSRTGETDSTSATNGAVKTLSRVIALHSGKTQRLTIFIRSGAVVVDSELTLVVPELTIYVEAGASLTFNKRTLLDTSNVTVGEGTWSLKCFTDILNVRVDGSLVIQNHTGSTGAGNQFYYPNGQGAIAICTDAYIVPAITYQTINFTHYGTISVGNNTTLFVYGSNGLHGYGSKLARYKRNAFGGSLTLGANATESALETDKLRETLVFEGSGSSKSVNIRRSYAFLFELVYNDGCTITVQPAANCLANANNTLTFSGAVGKTVTVRLTSNLSL